MAVVSGSWVETLENTENKTALANGHFTTYNFEVADWHTYFVGPAEITGADSAVWVHNTGELCARGLRRVKTLQRRGLSQADAIKVVKATNGKGIYQFMEVVNGVRNTYVGQSSNLYRRINTHLRRGKFDALEIDSLIVTRIKGGPLARLKAEQRKINEIGFHNTSNKINPIAEIFWETLGIPSR